MATERIDEHYVFSGDRLKRIRLQFRVLQKEVAEEMGYSHEHLNKIENGAVPYPRSPRLDGKEKWGNPKFARLRRRNRFAWAYLQAVYVLAQNPELEDLPEILATILKEDSRGNSDE